MRRALFIMFILSSFALLSFSACPFTHIMITKGSVGWNPDLQAYVYDMTFCPGGVDYNPAIRAYVDGGGEFYITTKETDGTLHNSSTATATEISVTGTLAESGNCVSDVGWNALFYVYDTSCAQVYYQNTVGDTALECDNGETTDTPQITQNIDGNGGIGRAWFEAIYCDEDDIALFGADSSNKVYSCLDDSIYATYSEFPFYVGGGYSTKWGYSKSNQLEGCAICTEGSKACWSSSMGVPGSLTDKFLCANNSWVFYERCSTDCPGFCVSYVGTYHVTDLYYNDGWVTVFDDFGNQYSQENGIYSLSASNYVNKIGFKIVDENLNSYNPYSLDYGISIDYNTTRANCTLDSTDTYSKQIDNRYIEKHLACTLNESYSYVDVNLSLQINLTNALPASLNQSYIIRFNKGEILISEEQVVFTTNETGYFSARLLDSATLDTISALENPVCNVSLQFYKVESSTFTNDANVSVNCSYDSIDKIYCEFETNEHNLSLKQPIKMYANCSASNYSNFTNYQRTIWTGTHRVRYFACEVIPETVSRENQISGWGVYRDDFPQQTASARLVCKIELINPDALTDSQFYSGFYSVYLDNMEASLADLLFHPDSQYVCSYSEEFDTVDRTGGTLTLSAENVKFSKKDRNCVLQPIEAGRYTKKNVLFNNNYTGEVRTYLSFKVQNQFPENVSIEQIGFLSSRYESGDDIYCEAIFYDKQDLVNSWTMSIYSDEHSYEFDAYSTPAEMALGNWSYSWNNTADGLNQVVLVVKNVDGCKMNSSSVAGCLQRTYPISDIKESVNLYCKININLKNGVEFSATSKPITFAHTQEDIISNLVSGAGNLLWGFSEWAVDMFRSHTLQFLVILFLMIIAYPWVKNILFSDGGY